MSLRTVFLLVALATANVSCVVYTKEPGFVASDGSVYLGFDLFDSRGKADRERIDVGQQLGGFSSFRLVADETVALNKVVVVFADGERFAAPVPRKLGANQSTAEIALPRGSRPIHSVVVTASSANKHLAKIEIYGKH